MPLPKTKDFGKVIKFLKKDKPPMPKLKKIAIALAQTGNSKRPSSAAMRTGSVVVSLVKKKK